MKTRAVQTLFILLCLTLAAALQEISGTFAGVKPPLLLALALHWAFTDRRRDEEQYRNDEGPSLPDARWVPSVAFAGAFEEALSGLPGGCTVGCFLLMGVMARVARSAAKPLPHGLLGIVALAVAAPLHEIWLAMWEVTGGASTTIIRVFASILPALPVGAVVFAIMPYLEEHAGFEGPQENRGRIR